MAHTSYALKRLRTPWWNWKHRSYQGFTAPPHSRTIAGQSPRELYVGRELVGRGGARYKVERILQEKHNAMYRVCIARSGGKDYILKNRTPSTFDFKTDMEAMVAACPEIRSLRDTIPESLVFVYEYLDAHTLSHAFLDLPVPTKQGMLKDVLKGIAALHEKDIVHTDIKADNVLFDWVPGMVGREVKRTQLSDVDDGALLEPGYSLRGMQLGNELWRSPEAWAAGPINKPGDMFSFGIYCIYSMLKVLPFDFETDIACGNTDPMSRILEEQMCMFGREEDMPAFLHLIRRSEWLPAFEHLWSRWKSQCQERHFSRKTGMPDDFKDFILGVTSFDTKKRMTASQALDHPWMRSIL